MKIFKITTYVMYSVISLYVLFRRGFSLDWLLGSLSFIVSAIILETMEINARKADEDYKEFLNTEADKDVDDEK